MASHPENRFGLLGPLVVEVGGEDRAPSAPRQRAVLGFFLLSPGEPIPAERLLDRLWGAEPPSGGVKTVAFHISKLRDALEPDRPRGSDGSIIITTPAGYVLDVDRSQVDAANFESLLQEARAALDQDPVGGASLVRDALGLWRGPALADFAYDEFAQDEIRRLEELRLLAVETRVAADLALGQHADLIAELEQLVTEHPLREGFCELLMLALYRSGRQADALRAYTETRQALAEQLGIEPSSYLRDLESRILDQDPELQLSAVTSPGRPAPRIDDVENPYKGLRPYGEDDADDFFGRDELVERVAAKLNQVGFAVLVGPSGSGKSSVAIAGVVPALRSSHTVLRMVPGDRPLDELEISLLRAFPDAPASAGEVLRSDTTGLNRAIRLVGEERPTLLVIDQFEELWSLAGVKERESFIDTLIDAIEGDRTPLHVLVTLRSDFLGEALSHPQLAGWINEGTVLVPPMTADELELAVTQPAVRAGVPVEPALAAAVVSDVADNPGALPLLQYALTEAFDHRESNELTRDDYQRVGGLRSALVRRAEQIYGGFDGAESEAARQIFLRLVIPGEGSGDTRRRAPIEELNDLGPEVDTVLAALGSARLLTFDRDPMLDVATVEVAHEAVLTQWDRLRVWITESREELTIGRRLADLAAEWDRNDQADEFLLTPGRLELYARFVETTSLLIGVTERGFLEASLSAEKRRRRRSRSVRVAIVATLSVVASVAVVAAFVAATNSRRAEDAARQATAKAIGADALEVLQNEPRLALLLAIEAAELDPRPDAIGVLQRVVDSQDVVYEFQAASGAIGARTWLPDFNADAQLFRESGILTTLEPDGAVQIRDLTTGEFIATGDSILAGSYFREAVTSNPGDPVASWMAYLPPWANAPFLFSSPFGEVYTSYSSDSIHFEVGAERSPQSSGVAALMTDARTALVALGSCVTEPGVEPGFCVVRSTIGFSGAESELLGSLPEATKVTSIAADDDRILVGTSRGLLSIPNRGGTPVLTSADTIPSYGAVVAGATDGTLAYTLDGRSLVLKQESQEFTFEIDDGIRAIAFSDSGNRLVVGTVRGTVVVYDVATRSRLVVFTSHRSPIQSVASNRDGSVVVAADVTGRIIATRTDRFLERVIGGGARSASYLESPTAVAIGPGVAVIGYSTGSEAEGFGFNWFRPEGVSSVALSSDGTRVFLGTLNGEIIEVETDSSQLVQRHSVSTGRVRSLAVALDGRLAVSIEGVPEITGLGSEVAILDLEEMRVTRHLFGSYTKNDSAVAWSHAGDTVAVGTIVGTVDLFDPDTGHATEIDLGGSVTRVAFTTADERLFALDSQGALSVIDIESESVIARSPAHTGVATLAIDPGGRWVATGGHDGFIRLWDQESGEAVTILRAETAPVYALYFSGNQIFFKNAFGDLDSVTMDIDDLLLEARSLVPDGRVLTATECRTYLGADC